MISRIFKLKLKIARNKLKILEAGINQYNIELSDLIDLMNQYLIGTEIEELFELNYFKNLTVENKMTILNGIENAEIKVKLLRNANFFGKMPIEEKVATMMENLSDDVKMQLISEMDHLKKYDVEVSVIRILTNKEERKIALDQLLVSVLMDNLNDKDKMRLIFKIDYWKECRFSDFEIVDMIKTLTDESKKNILLNKVFIKEKLEIENWAIIEIIRSIENSEIKLLLIKYYKYEVSWFDIYRAIESLSEKEQIICLLEVQETLTRTEIKGIIESLLSVDTFINIISNNQDLLHKNDIRVYEISRYYTIEKQLEFVSKFEDIGLSQDEKDGIIATLKEEVKKRLPEKYRKQKRLMEINNIDQIDFDQDLEKYRGWDEILLINAMKLSEKEKIRFFKLCQICPKLRIEDNLNMGISTVKEYLYGEIWIRELIQNINKDWTDLQKIAFVDNAIGKKISYDPTWNTEVQNHGRARALWKIIYSGYGICNGIAQLEKYIFDQIGIESESIHSEEHGFLKLKDIKWITADGELKRGNTILDPTWNLAAHKFSFMPSYFCRSYQEIRKEDIDDEGKDKRSHENDKDLADATLNLDDKTLRQVFMSLKITNEKGIFSIQNFIEKIFSIQDLNFPEKESIQKQLEALEEYYTDFANSINETTKILRSILSYQKNLKFKKCVVKRVYERTDPKKRPVLYIYIDFPQAGKNFYIANGTEKKFIHLSQKEFEERYECYQKDLEAEKGIRPWEEKEKCIQFEADLENK